MEAMLEKLKRKAQIQNSCSYNKSLEVTNLTSTIGDKEVKRKVHTRAKCYFDKFTEAS